MCIKCNIIILYLFSDRIKILNVVGFNYIFIFEEMSTIICVGFLNDRTIIVLLGINVKNFGLVIDTTLNAKKLRRYYLVRCSTNDINKKLERLFKVTAQTSFRSVIIT